MKRVVLVVILVGAVLTSALFATEKTVVLEKIELLKQKIVEVEKGTGKKNKADKKAGKEKKEADRPDTSNMHLELGNLYASINLYKDAVREYSIAHKMDKSNYQALYNMGVLYQRRKNNRAAASVFNEVIRLSPNYASAHYNLGATYENMGRSQKAISEYKIALELNPSLGKLESNPLVLNSKLLPTVNLLIYKETIGASSLPIEDTPIEN